MRSDDDRKATADLNRRLREQFDCGGDWCKSEIARLERELAAERRRGEVMREALETIRARLLLDGGLAADSALAVIAALDTTTEEPCDCTDLGKCMAGECDTTEDKRDATDDGAAFTYCPAHDYGDPGYPPDECAACASLNATTEGKRDG